jgi:predicted dinucleotide-binding enzyme
VCGYVKIGIIGSGNIGSTLARKLAKAGHSILIANSRGPETLKDLANETGAKTQGLPAGAESRIALSVAGDDPLGKQTVMSLVEATGFDAVDAGSLAESWRQQPITSAYCTELGADQLCAALIVADRDPLKFCLTIVI